MPSHFLPSKSTRHRLACISLYRALLTQSQHIPIPESCIRGPIPPLKHLIRKQFQRHINDTSHEFVKKALRAGYEAEALFHEAANGSPIAQTRILTHLKTLHAQSFLTRSQNHLNPAPPRLRPPLPAPYPTFTTMLTTRPRPSHLIRGVRKIPYLVNGTGLPFLRYQKPQSAFLSRVLRDKLRSRVESLALRDELRTQFDAACVEDKWEEVLGLNSARGHDENRTEPWWTWEVGLQKVELQEGLGPLKEKQAKLVEDMMAVIDGERSLAREEAKVMRREAILKWREKTVARTRKLIAEGVADRGQGDTLLNNAEIAPEVRKRGKP